MDKVREQSVESAKAAEKLLRQLTEMSSYDQALEVEVKSLKSKTDGVAKTRNKRNSFANAKS